MGQGVDTGLKPVWSQGSSTPLFVPLSEALDTTHLKEVRIAFQLAAVSANFQAQAAYRMSDDGITWGSATPIGTAPAALKSAVGWYFTDTTLSLTTGQKLFVQLGMEVSNTGGSQIEFGVAQIVLQVRDLKGRTLYANLEKVWADGSASAIFNALTDPVPAEQVAEVRPTLELIANSDNVGMNLLVQPAYQVSDDTRAWYSGGTGGTVGSFTSFGTLRSTCRFG